MAKAPPKLITAWLIAAAVAGCAGHATTARGTISGIFLMVGGPATTADPDGVRLPLPGHVIATSTQGERFTVSTGKAASSRCWCHQASTT